MAFGAYTGRSGIVGQRPYGLSAMFQGLSQGLLEFAKMTGARDTEEAKQKHEDAREAATRAAIDNLDRFKTKAANDLARELEAGRNAREDKRDTTTAQWHQEAVAEQAKRDAAAEAHQKVSESLQGRSLDIQAENKKSLEADRKAQEEQRKQAAEAAKAAMARGDATAAAKIADDMVSTPKANYAKALEEYKAITKNGIDPDSQEYKDAKNALDNAKSDVATAEKAAAPLRAQALKAIGYGDASTGAAPADPLSTLSPDQQAAAKAVIGARGLTPQQAADWAKNAPADVLQKAMALPAPKTTETQPTDGSFIPPDATQATAPADNSVAQTVAPADGTGGPDVASVPGPATANANEATGQPPQTGTTADDKTAQFQEIADKLNQSPDGQGVVATLNRLAEAKEGPVADKMRRAAQIQLEQQFGADSDTSNGFVDYYLDQNAQEPTIAADNAEVA